MHTKLWNLSFSIDNFFAFVCFSPYIRKKKCAIISKCVIMSTFYRSPADRLNDSLVWELLFQQPKSLQIVVEVAEDIFLRAFLPLRSSTSSGAYVRPTVLLGIIAIQYTSYSPGYCQVHDTGVWLQGLPD